MTLSRYQFSSFGKVLLRYASSQVISNLFRVIAGLLVVRLVDPEIYGVYSGVSIYIGYFALGHIGIINGLGREFPYQLGKGNDAYGKQLAGSTFAISTLIGFLSSIVFLILSVYHYIHHEYLLGITFLSYVIVAGLNLLNSQFLPVLYRTNADFDKLSKINITFGLWNIVSVLLIWKFGFNGLLIRGIALSVIQFYQLFKNKPYPLKIKPIKPDIVHLIKTGFPIFLIGNLNSLWMTIINNIIFSLGGARSFGLYALANIVQTTVMMIPRSFGQVIYPRMAIMYGQGKAPNEIMRLNLKPLFFQFFVMLTVALAGVLLLPVLIPWLLPKYIEGIPPAQWILFVAAITSFGSLNGIFNVIKQQKFYFFSLLTGAAIGTAYIYIRIVSSGFDLLIFPQGLLLGILIQQALSLFFAFRLK